MDYIREAITSGELVAGQTYSATYLGDLIGASRTPIREALLQLSRLGMIRIDKNKGATVLATTMRDLIEVFQIRLMLEVPATAHAARTASPAVVREIQDAFKAMQAAADLGDQEQLVRADRAFHQAVMRQTGNPKLEDVVRTVRNLVLTRDDREPQEVVDDHVDIVQAFIVGDGHAAAQSMQRHILHTAELLRGKLGGNDSGTAITSKELTEALTWPLFRA